MLIPPISLAAATFEGAYRDLHLSTSRCPLLRTSQESVPAMNVKRVAGLRPSMLPDSPQSHRVSKKTG